MSPRMNFPNKGIIDVDDCRSVINTKENKYLKNSEFKLSPDSSQRHVLIKQSPAQESFFKKEKLYHDNIVLNKVKSNLAEFQNRSIVTKMVGLKSSNEPISIRYKENISLTNDSRELKSSNPILEDIYKIKGIDCNFIENERKFNLENLPILPEINNNKIKKKESRLIDDKLVYNEEVDLTSGIHLRNIISDSKTVKLVKKFYKESKLNGYRNFISSNNSLIKKQKNKKLLDKRDTVSFSNDSLKFIVGSTNKVHI